MKIPHPLKTAKANRHKMMRDAQKQWQDYDARQHKSPVDNKLLWFLLIGISLMLGLKLLTVLMGG
ncbi:hypothetical protein LNP18_06365 [Leuconostoc citreum]|uniref:hypothetical protein n=1 Tax=Leuconostoc citreum TaxID=33964 RepID=UPI00200AFE53|nr:hypothetical protein [Leuconostoc citreum]MCK8605727.1 hypothetical protein [Leuconostoc citreum]